MALSFMVSDGEPPKRDESDPMSCESDCAVPGRREFLLRVTTAVAAALAGLAASPRDAAALPLGAMGPLSVQGDEVSYPLPTADCATIDEAREVILVRWKGAVYAFPLSCPHQKTALRWRAADSRFQCPKHKSKYQPDGAFISGKATRNMDRFAVRKQGKNVLVNLTKTFRSDHDTTRWTSATIRV